VTGRLLSTETQRMCGCVSADLLRIDIETAPRGRLEVAYPVVTVVLSNVLIQLQVVTGRAS
jgi:hypothetical protein